MSFDESNFKGCLESIYKDKYDLSNVHFIDMQTPVTLKCRTHGLFLETPYNLIVNQRGCVKCYNNQSLGEINVRNILDEYGIPYEQEKTFFDLKYKGNLKFDFFIESMGVAIEYQGIQHYKPIDFFGGMRAFREQKIRDEVKREFCKFYGYRLIEIDFSKDTLEQLKDLIDEYLESFQSYADY